MDFKKLCLRIDKNTSLPIHNYYQKVLSLLFINGKDPFNRKLLSIECEKKLDHTLADLYLKWDYNGKVFTEIVEVELQSKKKGIEHKIDRYYKRADFLSFCFPSQKLPSLIKVFSKIKKDLNKINIIYIIDSEAVTRNKRKIIDDQKMIISAHSPFMLTQCPSGDMSCVKEVVSRHKSIFFDTLIHQHFRNKQEGSQEQT